MQQSIIRKTKCVQAQIRISTYSRGEIKWDSAILWSIMGYALCRQPPNSVLFVSHCASNFTKLRHRNPLLVAANSLEPKIARRQECLRVSCPNLVGGPRANIISWIAPQPCPHSPNHSASPWPSRVAWFNRITFAPHNVCVSGTVGYIFNSSK